MAGEIEIRPATAGDLPAIAVIQAGAPEAAHWTASDYLDHDCAVALLDGRVAGFLVSRVAGDEREILNLAVAPDRRRRGVAAALLGAVLGSTPGRCFLEVRESNVAARKLYQALGFTEVSKRPAYYDNPVEAAIVMRFFS